jgi:hypothetical protein
MPGPNESVWGNINTLFEIGIEIYRLMVKNGGTKGKSQNTETEKLTDGVLLISNDKDVLITVGKDFAKRTLSDEALFYAIERGDYLSYPGAAAAIPLFELSRVNAGVRDYVVSAESLRATLSGSYPEYVKKHNILAPPEAQIKDADAPMYLFLQKQFDNAAGSIRAEVAEFQAERARESALERGLTDDVLELER